MDDGAIVQALARLAEPRCLDRWDERSCVLCNATEIPGTDAMSDAVVLDHASDCLWWLARQRYRPAPSPAAHRESTT